VPRLGHIALALAQPNRRIVTLEKWGATKEEDVDEEKEVYFMEDKEEVMEEENKGHLLVLRRALSSLKRTKVKQRENILHSRFTV